MGHEEENWNERRTNRQTDRRPKILGVDWAHTATQVARRCASFVKVSAINFEDRSVWPSFIFHFLSFFSHSIWFSFSSLYLFFFLFLFLCFLFFYFFICTYVCVNMRLPLFLWIFLSLSLYHSYSSGGKCMVDHGNIGPPWWPWTIRWTAMMAVVLKTMPRRRVKGERLNVFLLDDPPQRDP